MQRLKRKGGRRSAEEERRYLQYTSEFRQEDTNFCFWYKADDVAASDVRNGRPMGRANGMQVRCVKDE